jgi:hypothetical protein
MASESITSSSDVHLLSDDDHVGSSRPSAVSDAAKISDATGAPNDPESSGGAIDSEASKIVGASSFGGVEPSDASSEHASKHVLRSSAEIGAAAMIPLHTPEPDPLLKSNESSESAKPVIESRPLDDIQASSPRNIIEDKSKIGDRAADAARSLEETGDHPRREIEPNVIDHPLPDLGADDPAAAHALFHSESGSTEICPSEKKPNSATGIATFLGFNPDPNPRSKPKKPATASGSNSTSTSTSGSFDDVDAAPRGSPWPGVLLISYASAMTIACVWLVIKLKHHDPLVDSSPPPIDTRPDPGVRASHSRKVDSPPPIPPENRLELGRTLKIGSIEFTPIELVEKPVKLWREGIDGSNEERPGGDSAMALKIRVQNVSSDLIFAPLDEAFVRDRDHALPDGYLENERGERIYLYPLAVQSEWSIEGEIFRDLKPGEFMESNIYTVEFGADRFRSPMTWRIRLRTGIDRTDIVGVLVRPNDLKPATVRPDNEENGLDAGSKGVEDKTKAADPKTRDPATEPRDRLEKTPES